MRIVEPYIIYPRKLKSGKIIYYYQYRDEYGRRSNPMSTGCTALSKAKKFCHKLYNEGKFESVIIRIKFQTYAEHFFDEGSNYLEWRKANGNALKPETLRAYNKILHNQILPFFNDMIVKLINKDVAKKWIIWSSKQWSAKTINNAQGVLNIIFESAVDEGIMENNPLRNISLRKVTKKQRELLTIRELNELYHGYWSSERHRQMFLLACITGMRIGEISALQTTDIFDSYIHVKNTFSSNYGLGTTKTNKERYVPLPKSYEFPKSDCNWIFQDRNTKNPMKPHVLYNALIRNCDKINIDTKKRGITVHSLRNFFISYMQANNITKQKIKAVVGHADEDMTDHYTYWTPEMFKEIAEVQERLIIEITGEYYAEVE